MATFKKKPALGASLSALSVAAPTLVAGDAAANAAAPGAVSNVFEGELSMFYADDTQIRKVFAEEPLQQLAESIRDKGRVIKPIIVHPADADGRHKIADGERRWRASKLAGMPTIRYIVDADFDKLDQAAVNNLHERNSVREMAAFIGELVQKYPASYIAKRLGYSDAAVSTLRQLAQPHPLLDEVWSKEIVTDTASLAKLNRMAKSDDPAEVEVGERVLRALLSRPPGKKVGRTEIDELIHAAREPEPKGSAPAATPPAAPSVPAAAAAPSIDAPPAAPMDEALGGAEGGLPDSGASGVDTVAPVATPAPVSAGEPEPEGNDGPVQISPAAVKIGNVTIDVIHDDVECVVLLAELASLGKVWVKPKRGRGEAREVPCEEVRLKQVHLTF